MGLDINIYRKPNEPKNARLELITCFRKVNCLIEWVEENIGDFENCSPLLISKENLVLLREKLGKVDEENCEEVLPTTAGNFFGNVQYNELYWEDVTELSVWVDKTLREFDFEKNELFIAPNW